MATVHDTASVGPEVELDESVEVGPNCVITGRVQIGAGTQVIGHAWMRGPLVIGRENRIYPFACLGFEPQDYKWDPDRDGAGLVIGDRNIIREHVTMHRATNDDTPTRVGSDNMFMVNSHVGHDATVGDRSVFANNASLGGHTRIADQVNLGGGAAIGQHAWVGRLAFVSGHAGTRLHVPPFMVCRFRATVAGPNMVGLRRSGMSHDEIDRVRWAYRVMFRERRTKSSMIEALRERADEAPALREIVDFLEVCPGAICKPEGDRAE
ncbi:MAG: acyl-ACP--UDP-N-acetylglucosamine O-acyltransferase [Phycisphaerales bacterium]